MVISHLAFYLALLACLALGWILRGLLRPAVAWARAVFISAPEEAEADNAAVTSVAQVLHYAIGGSPVGVTVVADTGEVLLSNPSAHEMNVVHDRALHPDVRKVVEEVFEDREPRSLDLSIRRRRTGNRVTQVLAWVQPLKHNDIKHVVIYSTDESESVRMESARRDFVANVSHELKTPVGGIALLAEALLEAPEDPEHVRYFGERVQKEAARMANMVNELIALSKLQGAERLPDMEPVLVDDLVDEAMSRNQFTADAHDIELTRSDNTKVEVLGDSALLVTALSNLISNAINYSPNGTPVTVTQKVVGDDVILIRVTDRGIGIAPDDQKRVFERFFRVDKARSRQTGGTGLGLAIVKHVVANHGGNIKLWSRPGTGSTFTMEMPIHRDGTPAPTPVPADKAARLDNGLDVKGALRGHTRRKD